MDIPGWLWTLPWADPKGFWLNVWAGIPFLFFDLVIITMLLPGAIEWWNRFRWKGSRRAALRYLFSDYAEKNYIHLLNLVRELKNSSDMSSNEFKSWEARARDRFAEAKFDMESCLQTALGSKPNQSIDNVTDAARVWSLVGDGRCMCLKALA